MNIHKKYLVILVLSLVSLGISILLTYSHYSGVPVPCSVTNGCETVLASKYAVMFGLPLSVWGILFNACVAVLALSAGMYKKADFLLQLVLGLGGVASLVFLFLQFAVIQKICQYCLATDLITVFLFLWNLNTHAEEKPIEN